LPSSQNRIGPEMRSKPVSNQLSISQKITCPRVKPYNDLFVDTFLSFREENKICYGCVQLSLLFTLNF